MIKYPKNVDDYA